ncbi:MAG: tRNA 2-thiocytidine(32) synthetase TtcA [Deltaproteobacteria bacterium]|nr:tRNA 2-thiocytidine(32) synthetase TtcA [Deltaproteobacteria bacterium]
MHPRKLESRILKAVNLANRDFNLFEAGDRILVAMSGGKDSFALLWAISRLQAALPQKFEIVAYHLDQGQPGHNVKPLEQYLKEFGVPFEIEFQDTYSRVIKMTEPGKVFCAWCSRFRRAILYKAARKHGCNKVALGHHRDDLVETFLLNAFFTGQLKTMPPRLVSDKGAEQVIRPLVYVGEEDLFELVKHKEFPIMPCSLCSSQNKERKAVKQLLTDLSQKYPRIRTSILAALGRIRKTHVLDKTINPLFSQNDSETLTPTGLDSDEVGCIKDGNSDCKKSCSGDNDTDFDRVVSQHIKS